jgi:hypothetical protein
MLPLDLRAFSIAARWRELPAEVDPMELARTVEDPAFPGAILPAAGPNGVLYWYAAATSGTEWRLLQPLLLAYVGPTLTTFSGQMSPLRADVPAEQLLVKSGISTGARLVPGEKCERLAAHALGRLRRAVASRPAGASGTVVSTPQLLARLEMCVAAGDRPGAIKHLEVLRAERRIDTLNAHFLEVRILSTFRAWRELVDKEWFSELAIARKPSAVARAMLEALWYAYLDDVASDLGTLRVRYQASVRPLARSLIGQVSDVDDSVLTQLKALEAAPTPVALPPAPAAQELLDQAAEAPGLRRTSQARVAIAALPQEDRNTLIESAAGQRALAEVGPLNELAPTNWVGWLQMLSDRRFAHAMPVAQEAVSQWPAAGITLEQAAPIAHGLIEVGLSEGLGHDRLLECIPWLVSWVKNDPGYPRRPLRDVYTALLGLFALMESRGQSERDAAADLMDACLTLGVTAEGYRQLLADFRTMIDAGAGESSIYWLIDLAAILLQHPAPDPDQRLAFLNTLLNSFQSHLRLLTRGQRAAYNRVAAGASWPALPPPLETDTAPGLGALRGQSVAIYTLTESAGRQAEIAIKEQEPRISVDLAHDHVASPRLARLARDADVFVLTAAAAKHAATDCILANRGHRPLLYAPGRGFSGIVRVLEAYAANAGAHDTVH